jgi:glycosyltransferase involved in cell wall biosynthesis
MKTITFLLPGPGNKPIGGAKVVYEYANRLINDGYAVNIVYPTLMLPKEMSFCNVFIRILRYFYYFFTEKYKCSSWFSLNEKVNEKWVWTLSEKYIPKSDIVFATSWRTAIYLNNYKETKNKIYFIQAYENWDNNESRLIETWKYPMLKVTIAPWLQKLGEKLGEMVLLVENGFDFDYFELYNKIETRNPYVLCMLNHTDERKGVPDGFKAIEIAKQKYPQITLNLFGFPQMPKNLPDWINYHQKPDRKVFNDLYNQSAMYVAPSRSEGFCLTVGEAMQCGCAVACTDADGYTVVCHNEETALVSPVKNPAALAYNIIRLIENQDLKNTIARNGSEYIRQFTWERAYSKLKNIINNMEIK